MYILATLRHGIELPALSHRTGRPCRAVKTRELVLDASKGFSIAGMLDRSGRAHLSALRNVISVQRGMIACARGIPFTSPILWVLRRLPCAVDYSTDGSRFAYYSMGVEDDQLMTVGAWADTQGNIIAQMQQVCGLIVPAGDPVIAPFRVLGHLWSNGQFARSASDEIVSFVKGRGVVFVAQVPRSISDHVLEHFGRGWGESWMPGPIDQRSINHARDIERACRIRHKAQDPFDAKLIKQASTRESVDLRAWHVTVPQLKSAQHIWRNGVSRDGTRVDENTPFNHLFVAAGPDSHAHSANR